MDAGFLSETVNIPADRGDGLPERVQLTLWVNQDHSGDSLFNNDVHPLGPRVTIRHIRTSDQLALYEVIVPKRFEETIREGITKLLAARYTQLIKVLNDLRTALSERPSGPGVTHTTGRV